jgi:hypothetical protein
VASRRPQLGASPQRLGQGQVRRHPRQERTNIRKLAGRLSQRQGPDDECGLLVGVRVEHRTLQACGHALVLGLDRRRQGREEGRQRSLVGRRRAAFGGMPRRLQGRPRELRVVLGRPDVVAPDDFRGAGAPGRQHERDPHAGERSGGERLDREFQIIALGRGVRAPPNHLEHVQDDLTGDPLLFVAVSTFEDGLGRTTRFPP